MLTKEEEKGGYNRKPPFDPEDNEIVTLKSYMGKKFQTPSDLPLYNC